MQLKSLHTFSAGVFNYSGWLNPSQCRGGGMLTDVAACAVTCELSYSGNMSLSDKAEDLTKTSW